MITTTTATAAKTATDGGLSAAIGMVIDHAIVHRDGFDASNIFDVVADARLTLTVEQIADLPGMTDQVREAYLAVRSAHVLTVCLALRSWTSVLDDVQAVMFELAGVQGEYAWFSLLALRNVPLGVSRATLDMLLDQMEYVEDIELISHDDMSELPEAVRAALDEAAIEIDGRKLHWLRFIPH